MLKYAILFIVLSFFADRLHPKTSAYIDDRHEQSTARRQLNVWGGFTEQFDESNIRSSQHSDACSQSCTGQLLHAPKRNAVGKLEFLRYNGELSTFRLHFVWTREGGQRAESENDGPRNGNSSMYASWNNTSVQTRESGTKQMLNAMAWARSSAGGRDGGKRRLKSGIVFGYKFPSWSTEIVSNFQPIISHSFFPLVRAIALPATPSGSDSCSYVHTHMHTFSVCLHIELSVLSYSYALRTFIRLSIATKTNFNFSTNSFNSTQAQNFSSASNLFVRPFLTFARSRFSIFVPTFSPRIFRGSYFDALSTESNELSFVWMRAMQREERIEIVCGSIAFNSIEKISAHEETLSSR